MPSTARDSTQWQESAAANSLASIVTAKTMTVETAAAQLEITIG